MGQFALVIVDGLGEIPSSQNNTTEISKVLL